MGWGVSFWDALEKEPGVKTGPVNVNGQPDCSGRQVVKIDEHGNVTEK
jgi:hypothetical protein